ncbi:glycosyl transferase group 1 [Vibrio astriarenae]|nr:glycosyl transferase group 1 [Vibrio sp. C7]
MNILIYTQATLPVQFYGGTERVVWDLAHALHRLGHHVTLLAGKGTKADNLRVVEYQEHLPLAAQIPNDIDIVHFHAPFEPVDIAYVRTQHGNSGGHICDPNTIFVSQNHAENHGAQAYVHNGLNWDNYTAPSLTKSRDSFHFLGKAAWRLKNVQGAIDITKKAGQRLEVMGGTRLNFKMGFRMTLDRHVKFLGSVDDKVKAEVMGRSKGLVFPVTWHEPFGLAVTESLYFGCPVFGTPYGALPELVNSEVGVLSNFESDLVTAIEHAEQFIPSRCHEYARDSFNANTMAKKYVKYYSQVLNGGVLNTLTAGISQFKKLEYIK